MADGHKELGAAGRLEQGQDGQGDGVAEVEGGRCQGGAAQLGGPGLARAALDLGYPLALAALAVLEAAGCAQLLLAVRHAGARLR